MHNLLNARPCNNLSAHQRDKSTQARLLRDLPAVFPPEERSTSVIKAQYAICLLTSTDMLLSHELPVRVI